MFVKPCFQTFPNFWPKNRVFDSKTQTLRSFFEIFEIDVQFWLISELFSELKFPSFFPNFFAKILRVRKFCFFKKISKLWQPNISKTRKNEKFRRFYLTQGLSFRAAASGLRWPLAGLGKGLLHWLGKVRLG